MDAITITQPDDFHLHLRDGAALASVVAASAHRFARAMVMPNLDTPVVNVDQALAYRQRILDSLPEESHFDPLMTLYLTDHTSIAEISRLLENEHVYAMKYYPAGATTHSDQGVTSLEKVYKVLERMTELDVPLLAHGEVADPDVDIFDREQRFIETVLEPLLQRFTGLRIVLEHITTGQAVDFVRQGPETLAATITPQHLMYNRNALFREGLRPHHYCLPVLKRERHRLALISIAVSGHPRFFLGTDSAPHSRHSKENACACAGIYSAHAAIEFYAEVFEREGNLMQLEQFASFNGADFYGLPRNRRKITLQKKEWLIPQSLPFAEAEIVPLKAGEVCHWSVATDEQ
ncbi:MAG: dihydroorotase [Gammaproteobacteria bacterium]